MRIRLARLAAATALPLALASCSFLQGLFGSDDGTEDGSGEASSSAEAVSVAISEPTTVRTIKSSGSLTLTVSHESAGDVYFVFTIRRSAPTPTSPASSRRPRRPGPPLPAEPR